MLPWDEFLRRYRPLAHAIASALAHRPSDAEDIVQEAALALFAAARRDSERFREPEFARNYYLRTVRNLAVRQWERGRGTTPLAEDPTAPSTSSSLAAGLADRRSLLARLLRELPRRDRQLVARRFLKRQTLAEISAATHVPISTLHNRERRILAQLRERAERSEPHDS